MYHYAAYVSTLCECIKEKGITVEQLTSFLLNLSALKYQHDQCHLLAGKRELLKRASTINKVFDVIGEECASFLNYGIFRAIATKFEVVHKDLNYAEHLKEYLNKHKLSEFVKVVKQMGPLMKEMDPTKMEITFKLDIEVTNTIARVYDLEIAIADALGLDPMALELTDVSEGCLIAKFLIPMIAADVIFTNKGDLTDDQVEQLMALPIIWVKYEGHEYILNKIKTMEAQGASDARVFNVAIGTAGEFNGLLS